MNTKKLKTGELIGAALDWAVAKCEGKNGVLHDDGITRCIVIAAASGVYKGTWKPSVNWSQGGPIIEREKIDTEGRWNVRGCGVRTSFKEWYAIHPKNHGGLIRYTGYGPTPLVAAMRCYVASKLGDEVEVPNQLTS